LKRSGFDTMPRSLSSGVFGILKIAMANKPKKKRNKQYRGADASAARPTVTKISAVHRSKPRQWWHDNKRIAKPVIIASLVVIAIIWLVIELFRITSGA